MNSLYLLIPISLMFTVLAVWAFLWSVNSDQFEDLDKAAHSILFDGDDEDQAGHLHDEHSDENDHGRK